MSAFEGFLRGFTQTGSDIIQRQDAEDADMRKLLAASDLQLRNSLTVNTQEANNAILKQQAEMQMLEEARAKAKGSYSPAAAPLQMGAEDTDVEIALESMPNEAPAAPAAATVRSYEAQIPSLDTYIDNAKGKTPQEIRANAEAQRRKDLIVAQRMDMTANKGVKTPTDPFSKARSAQEEEELTRAFAARSNYDTYMADLEKTEAAAKNTFSRFGVNVSTGASVLKEAGTKGALQFVSQTKGAISNAEMELFKQASVSEDNPRAFNLTVINASKAVLIREKQKADFVEAWAARNGGKTDGALAAFRKYAEENKIIAQGKKPGTLVLRKDASELAKDTTYLKYLDPNYSKAKDKKETTSAKEEKKASSVPSSLADKFPSLRGM